MSYNELSKTEFKIRFILNNHMYYDTPEKLQTIMDALNIKPDEFNLKLELTKWKSDNNFIECLKKCDININAL